MKYEALRELRKEKLKRDSMLQVGKLDEEYEWKLREKDLMMQKMKAEMESKDSMARWKLEMAEIDKKSLHMSLAKVQAEKEELKQELENTRKHWKMKLDVHQHIYEKAIQENRETFEKEMKARMEQMKAAYSRRE